jgi:hypothetical protein
MRGGSLEEFTRGLFFMDECRVWVFVGVRRKRRKRIYHREHRDSTEFTEKRGSGEEGTIYRAPTGGGNCWTRRAGLKELALKTGATFRK